LNPLDTLLRPAIAMVNRQIGAKTPARELCDELDGKCVAVRVRNTGLCLYLRVSGGRLVADGDDTEAPDVAITGSLLALGGLAGPGGESLVRHGEIDITGDAIVAQRFQRLLKYGRPDIEEELATIVGDVAAHRLGEMARAAGRWSREARDTMRQNVSEYLQEEMRVAPTRYEVEDFASRLAEMRDGVERLEARLKRLETGSGGAAS